MASRSIRGLDRFRRVARASCRRGSRRRSHAVFAFELRDEVTLGLTVLGEDEHVFFLATRCFLTDAVDKLQEIVELLILADGAIEEILERIDFVLQELTVAQEDGFAFFVLAFVAFVE